MVEQIFKLSNPHYNSYFTNLKKLIFDHESSFRIGIIVSFCDATLAKTTKIWSFLNRMITFSIFYFFSMLIFRSTCNIVGL